MGAKKLVISAIISAVFSFAAFGAEEVVTLWGDDGGYTAVIASGEKWFIQEEGGRRGPYAKVFPLEPAAPWVRARGVELSGKKDQFLVGSEGERFGPYSHIKEHRSSYPTALYECRRPDGERDLILDDGRKLTLVGAILELKSGSLKYGRGEPRLPACLAKVKDGIAFILGTSVHLISGNKDLDIYGIGFAGKPETYWLLASGRDKPKRLCPIRLDASGRLEQSSLASLSMAELGLVADKADPCAGIWGIGDLYGYDEDSGVALLKYNKVKDLGKPIDKDSPRESYLFTGNGIRGPFDFDPDWYKAKDATVSEDGSVLVFPFKRGGAWYLDFNGEIAGPFEEVLGAPWFTTEDGKSALALVRKGGKAYALLDGREIGGPWDEARRLKSPFAGHTCFMARLEGKDYLYSLGERIAGPFPEGVDVLNAFMDEGHRAFEMVRVTKKEKGSEYRYWYEIDGAAGPEFEALISRLTFSRDGRVAAYVAGLGERFAVVGDKKYGPFTYLSAFFPYLGGLGFIANEGSKAFLFRDDGIKLRLDHGSPTDGPVTISGDGRVIGYSAWYAADKDANPIRASRVAVDGKSHVGYYDRATGTILVWDAKAKAVRRLNL